MDKDVLKIQNEQVEIIINSKKPYLRTPELAAEAILALIPCVDIKEFEAIDVSTFHDRFDIYMEAIIAAVRYQCEWAGWHDKD